MAVENEKKSSKNKIVIILLVILVLLLIGGGVTAFVLFRGGNEPSSSGAGLTPDGQIPYEAGGYVGMLTSATLDDLFNQDDNMIPLHFSNTALSDDGETFVCILGNPNGAKYDMYFDIYTDISLNEQIYISGLLAPGTQLEGFKSKKIYPAGQHDAILVLTTVDEDHRTIVAQQSVVLTLEVLEGR